jgi:phosphoenolpyruvate-protein phosphotransferase
VITLEGTGLSPGVAHGAVMTVRSAERPAIHSHDFGDARTRFAQARLRAEADLRRAIEELPPGSGPATQILRAHLILMADPVLLAEVESRIARDQVTALEALDQSAAALASRFESLRDPALQARARDLRDVCDCIARHLSGGTLESDAWPPEGSVICASDLTPAQLLRLAQARPLGFVLEQGAETSHTSILMRALAVPAVIRVAHATTVLRDGDLVVVDGDNGRVIARPDTTTSVQVPAAADSDPHPAVTCDGVTIAVTASIGGASDARRAVAAGADGIGLFRTEAIFLASQSLPAEDVQVASYRDVFAAVGARPLTVRVLDLGGDKQPVALPWPREANPALGVRGVRLSLVRPDLFVTQFRALIRAAEGRPLRLLLPMVVDIGDVERMRTLIADAACVATAVPTIELGVMIETPAAALMARELAAAADFLSIGTNDLTQYVLAADRDSADVASLCQPLHPAIIRLLRSVATTSRRHGTPISVCGESAGDPSAVLLFLGMGVTELSVVPSAVPRIKAFVRRVSTDAARALVEEVAEFPTAAAVTTRLRAAVGALETTVDCNQLNR